jgi:hypothetical protein
VRKLASSVPVDPIAIEKPVGALRFEKANQNSVTFGGVYERQA